jgi:hypothetical protein
MNFCGETGKVKPMHRWTPMFVFLRILNLLLLVIIPGVPLLISWRRFVRHHFVSEGSRLWPWLLYAATCSFLWLLMGLLWGPIIGPSYTSRLYVTYVNLAVLVAIGLGGIFIVHPAKRLAITSVSAVALGWMWVLVVASAV